MVGFAVVGRQPDGLYGPADAVIVFPLQFSNRIARFRRRSDKCVLRRPHSAVAVVRFRLDFAVFVLDREGICEMSDIHLTVEYL